MGDDVEPIEERAESDGPWEFDRYGRLIIRDPRLAATLWHRSRRGQPLEVVLGIPPPTPVPQPINSASGCMNGPKNICPFQITVGPEIAFDGAWRRESNPLGGGG